MVVGGWQSLGTMVVTATAKATATVTVAAKGWCQAVDSAIMAKLRLGGLRSAITGDKKLYSKDEYDSNAENEVHK
jgi:hypothetical protein